MGPVKRASKRTRSPDPETGNVRCVCGTTDETDNGETWIACNSCQCRQHFVCMGIEITDDESLANFQCEKCAPDSHKELLDASARGVQLWEDRRKLYREGKNEDEAAKRRDKKRAKKRAKNERNSMQHENMDDADDAPTNDAITASFPLTKECHHYTSISEVPWDIQK